MKKRRSTCDLISDLPDNVIEHILVQLPLIDAVKTSVLSQKWRHKWKTISQLVFDNTFTVNPLREQFPTKNELLLTIYQVLLFHCGPILKFTLSVSELESCTQISHVIQFLSRNSIQELTLSFSKGEHYTVPSCLFSSVKLRHLHLSFCSFKPPSTFKGFNRLISVHFDNVNFDAYVINTFILKCPLLETLTIECCSNIDCLNIHAPNLKNLDIASAFNSICFRDTLALTTLLIRRADSQKLKVKKGCTLDMLEVFGFLPRIEYLHIGLYFLMTLAAGNIPKLDSTDLNNLRTLILEQMCFNRVAEVSCALCLIRSSPCLQKLVIEVFFAKIDGIGSVVKFLEDQNHLDISLQQLQEVEMQSFECTGPEMEFVKLLLAKSPSLERLHIQSSENISTNDELRVLREIARFRRASSVAEISFSGSNEENS